jgi:hypothetical protein
MTNQVFKTKADAETYAMSLRDSRRDAQTGVIYARDPIQRALGRVYINPCIAFTKSGKRVRAYTITIGA